MKEKAALESTLSALTADGAAGADVDEESEAGADEDGTAPGDAGGAGGSEPDGTEGEGRVGGSAAGTAAENTGSSNTGASSAELKAVKAKLTTLAKSLATISEEKANMEARFQKDKKKENDAHRAAVKQLTEDTEAKLVSLSSRAKTAECEREGMKDNLQQLTEQLLSGHQAEKSKNKEWEKERKLHREQLEAASHQRSASDKTASKAMDLEEELRLARDNEVAALTELSNTTNELKDKIADLEEQLATTTKDLVAAKSKGEGDVVLRLKHELQKAANIADKYKTQAAQASEQQQEVTRDAQYRIEAAAAKLDILSLSKTEKDVGVSREMMLQESRLTELSQLVGRYEASRLEDSIIVKAMREDNADLAERLQLAEDKSSADGPDGASSTNSARMVSLEREVVRLQGRLQSAQLANQRRLADDVDAGEGHGNDAIVAPPWHGLVLQNELSTDVIEARDVADRLYEKACESATAKGEFATKLQRTVEAYRTTSERLDTLIRASGSELAAAQAEFIRGKEEAETAFRSAQAESEAVHGDVVRRMTKRAQKVRERTLELLTERDSEIARLRGTRPNEGADVVIDGAAGSGSGGGAASARRSPPSSRSSTQNINDGMGTGATGQTLIHSMLDSHQAQRAASNTRQKLRDLETALDEATYKDELLNEQSQALKEEVRRLDANARREGANLEYLKNVMLRYLTQETGKEQSLLVRCARVSP
jgi:hypothetical protein